MFRQETPGLEGQMGRSRDLFEAPPERLPWGLRLGLAVEILRAYVTMRRWLPRADLRELVRRIRAGSAQAAGQAEHSEAELRRAALRLGNAVSRTLGVLPTDSRCLVQSLVLMRLLARRGISNVLVIGARSGSEFEAHAWIEYHGRAVLPTQGFEDARLLEL